MEVGGKDETKRTIIEPRVIITHIKEGSQSVVTNKEEAYKKAREGLFNPHLRFSPEVVENVLQAQAEELDEAIQNSPLKGKADRNGYSLDSLRRVNSTALQELLGDSQDRIILKMALDMITDEEEKRIRDEAKSLTREGVIIDRKTGSIVYKKFPNNTGRNLASMEAQTMKADFLKGEERLHNFISELK